MLTFFSRAGSFRGDRRSTAAMEFAFLAPVMVSMLLGVFELANAAIVYEQLQNAAHTMPSSASNLAVQSNGGTELSYNEIQLVASQIWGEVPELRTGEESGSMYVTLSSVTFIPTLPSSVGLVTTGLLPGYAAPGTCTPGQSYTNPTPHCNYTPVVVWSVGYAGGDSGRTNIATAIRSCTNTTLSSGQSLAYTYHYFPQFGGGAYNYVTGALNNDAPPNAPQGGVPTWHGADLSSLPTSPVAYPDPEPAPPSPIIVVDVHLKYHPILGLFFGSGVDFYATGFYPVRSVQSSSLSTNNNQTTTTAQTLSQQFTTIYDLDTTATNLTGAPGTNGSGNWCINTTPFISPADINSTAPSA